MIMIQTKNMINYFLSQIPFIIYFKIKRLFKKSKQFKESIKKNNTKIITI